MEQRRKVIEDGEREQRQERCSGGMRMWRMGESEQREAAAAKTDMREEKVGGEELEKEM